MRSVCLDVGDAVELGELLGFLVCWMDSGNDGLDGSLTRFVGNGSYGIGELRTDLARFAFVLGCGSELHVDGGE